MSIYKPSLLDKFKDFVNGLKGNWDQYEDHVADFESHQAEVTSEIKIITRDLQLTGDQITPAFSRKPKLLFLIGQVPGTNNFSYGMVDNIGNRRGVYTRSDGTWDGQVSPRVISVREMPGANVTYATVEINSNNSVTLNWEHLNEGATGTISVYILAFFHGED